MNKSIMNINVLTVIAVTTLGLGQASLAQTQAKKPVVKTTTTKPKTNQAPTAKPTATPKQDQVTSTYSGSGTMDINKVTPQKPVLARLDKSIEQIKQEEAEIEKIIRTSNDDCAKDEARIRQMDMDFLKKNSKQIEEIIGQVQGSLRSHRTIVRAFESGNVSGEETVEYTNSKGQKDQSAMIVFYDVDASGQRVQRQVAVKDLLAYIYKFEEAAAKIADEPKAIEDFLAKWRRPETASDPAYFNMTLQTAMKAYTGCVSGCLDSVYRNTGRERTHGRKFFVGSGKDVFRVSTTTTIGWSPEFETHVGSQLQQSKTVDSQSKVTLVIAQNFGEAMRAAKEDDYWSVIRAQQLTIDGVPVDGLLRRIYFDEKRRPECQKKASYTFNQKADPGPFFNYEDKIKCEKFGMEIISASITKIRSYNGRASVGAVFDITEGVKSEANEKESVTSTFYRHVQSTGIGSCDDVSLLVRYRCGCERTTREKTIHYKIDRAISFGC